MPTTTEISTYVTSLASATLAGTEEVYLASDEKTTTQAIADLNGSLITTIVNIGDWDMDLTDNVNVAHGLTFTKIRGWQVVIIDDTTVEFLDLNFSGSSNLSSTNFSLFRTTAGDFDNTDYDSTSFNRGYITIQHIP